MLFLFSTLAFCIAGAWDALPWFLAVRLPKPVRWASYTVLGLYYAWGVLIVRYNVNYTPCWRSIAGDYFIATGGPYAIVRHPMYEAKAVFPLVLFCATGFLPCLLGLASWTVLPYQARMEEDQMETLAGAPYRAYRRAQPFLPGIGARGDHRDR